MAPEPSQQPAHDSSILGHVDHDRSLEDIAVLGTSAELSSCPVLTLNTNMENVSFVCIISLLVSHQCLDIPSMTEKPELGQRCEHITRGLGTSNKFYCLHTSRTTYRVSHLTCHKVIINESDKRTSATFLLLQ